MVDNKAPMNYTLGRGELFFAQYAPGTENEQGERYLGNTPEFNMTIEEEALDHYSSDHGVNEKDASISLSTNRTGSLTTDNISPENVALFFFGAQSTFTHTGATVTDEAVAAVKQGLTYQLGKTTLNPVGARDLDFLSTGPNVNIIVTDDAGSPATFDEGDDYTIDMDLGRLYIVPGGAITDGTNLEVDYKTKTTTRDRIISGANAIQGALRFISFNPEGKRMDYYMPKVKLTPNGDYNLKGDEWQQIPFTIEILKKSDREAIYVEGRKFA